jgi:hypothetical protein
MEGQIVWEVYMMKNFFTILLGIVSVIVLIYGHSYWNKKIEAAPKSEPTSPVVEQAPVTKEAVPTVNPADFETEMVALTSNWPGTASEQFKQSIKVKRAYKVLFVGSPAIGSDTDGAYPLVKEKLIEAFGEDNIEVAVMTFNTTSTQLIKNEKQAEIAASGADLIIFEPFILLNNGYVLTENTFKDINRIISDVKAKNPNVTFILQPSYPLYHAKIYPRQVAELKNFAEKNKITYLDHWTVWPDPNTAAIKDYLLPDQSAPSQKGNQVWSEYLLNFLVSKSGS